MELALDAPAWRDQARAFTPTSVAADRVLEFTIKAYPQHQGVTRELHGREPGARLLMSAPFGTIRHRGAGTFIAGGAGITPFIAILRELDRTRALAGHSLLFSNKTPADIICEKELRHCPGNRCRLPCTDAAAAGYEHRRIDAAYLKEAVADFGQQFYVCGPPGFTDAVTAALKQLGADPQTLVFEQ